MQDGVTVVAGRDTSLAYDPGVNGNPSPSNLTLGGARPSGSAQVEILAEGDIILSSIQAASTGTAITVSSRSGQILDGGDALVDLLLPFSGIIAVFPCAVFQVFGDDGVPALGWGIGTGWYL